MTWLRGAVEACALVVAALLLCLVVGAANPLPHPVVSTDALGPDNSETVADYLGRARAGLADLAGDPDLHWALVSFDSSSSPEQVAQVATGERVAQVLVRVSIDRVQTQVIAIGVSGSPESILESENAAATTLQGSVGQWDRQSRIDAASAPRLAAGCYCVVGLIVHAAADALLSMQAKPGVRVVEALPQGATAGKFAVRALLPDYVDVVGPLPDDGPVPPP
ncbi:hypothetical protein QMK17_07160 [Rhodococcus sp. G-MC3]|uniref:hypothetical protein n=1 Tax=Rhodococcus sp. G-MC3 TaxID=3046209 RepID=UPI0024BA3D31|nr:hypothetical protein [Rhodococcus sp. G-MC3]MDJ0393108.1 hypothetical protein [Rhodococcus sp. G-MC3]